MRMQSENEVPLDVAKLALKNPQIAEFRIKQAIEALPEEQREDAGGMRVCLTTGLSKKGGPFFCVNKDFLMQLVVDGVVETHGINAGEHVKELLTDAGLASKWPRRA